MTKGIRSTRLQCNLGRYDNVSYTVGLVNERSELKTRAIRHYTASNVSLASVPLDLVKSVFLRFFRLPRISRKGMREANYQNER